MKLFKGLANGLIIVFTAYYLTHTALPGFDTGKLATYLVFLGSLTCGAILAWAINTALEHVRM